MDSILNIKATGTEQVKRSVMEIQSSFKQMGTLADKMGRQGGLSPKNLMEAKKAVDAYNKSYDSGRKILVAYKKDLDSIGKSYEEASKKQKEFVKGSAEWEKQAKEMSKLSANYGKVLAKRDKLAPAMSQGKDLASDLENASSLDNRQSTTKGILAAVGLGSALAIFRKSFAGSGNVGNNLIDAAGMLHGRGSLGKEIYNLSNPGSSVESSVRLGYSKLDVSNVAGAFASTGGWNGDSKTVRESMKASRWGGLPLTAFSGLASTSAAGGRFFTDNDIKALGTVYQNALDKAGFKTVTFEKFVDSVSSLTESFQQGNPTADPRMVAGLLSAISGNPLLQGARGAAALGTLNDSLSNPGGGIAGQMAMYRLAGGGAGKSFVQTQEILEGGFGGGTDENPTGRNLLTGYLKRARGLGGEGGEQFLHYVGGLKWLTAKALMEENGGGALEDKIGGFNQATFKKWGSKNGIFDDPLKAMRNAGLGPAILQTQGAAVASNSFINLGQDSMRVLENIEKNTRGGGPVRDNSKYPTYNADRPPVEKTKVAQEQR